MGEKKLYLRMKNNRHYIPTESNGGTRKVELGVDFFQNASFVRKFQIFKRHFPNKCKRVKLLRK